MRKWIFIEFQLIYYFRSLGHKLLNSIHFSIREKNSLYNISEHSFWPALSPDMETKEVQIQRKYEKQAKIIMHLIYSGKN